MKPLPPLCAAGPGVPGFGEADRVAQQRRGGCGRGDPAHLHPMPGRGKVPVDRSRAHRFDLVDRLPGRERLVEVASGLQERQPDWQHHREVLRAWHAHQRPDMFEQCPRVVAVVLGAQLASIDLLGRSRQLRPGQCSSRGRASHARRRDYLIKDSAPISLRCFLVCSPEFVRDVPSRSHRNLAFHWASFALKVVEAPAPPTRSKNVRHVGFLTTG